MDQIAPTWVFLFFFLYSDMYIRYTSGMSNNYVKVLLEERAGLLSELGSLSHVLHGSWVERFSVCSRPRCKCHSGEKHGPRRYLVVRENGRQRQKYIPNAQVDAAIRGRNEYHRLCGIVERITQINLLLMKEDAYED